MAIATAMQPVTGNNTLARKLESNNSCARLSNDLTAGRIFHRAAASVRRPRSRPDLSLRSESAVASPPPLSVGRPVMTRACPLAQADRRRNADLNFMPLQNQQATCRDGKDAGR